MGNTLHEAIVSETTDDFVELLDQRTGLHIGFPRLNAADDLRAMLGDEFYRAIGQLGFFEDIAIAELRARQYEIRIRLQGEVRDDAIRGYGEFITKNVPYYRDTLKLDPSDLTGRDGLRRLPILARADLREHFNELLSDGVSYSDHLAEGRMVWTRTEREDPGSRRPGPGPGPAGLRQDLESRPWRQDPADRCSDDAALFADGMLAERRDPGRADPFRHYVVHELPYRHLQRAGSRDPDLRR